MLAPSSLNFCFGSIFLLRVYDLLAVMFLILTGGGAFYALFQFSADNAMSHIHKVLKFWIFEALQNGRAGTVDGGLGRFIC